MAVVLVVRLVVNSTSMKLTYVSRSTCVNGNESELERGVRLGSFGGQEAIATAEISRQAYRRDRRRGMRLRHEAIVSVMLEHGRTPVAAVIAMVLRGDAMILVRRVNPPDAGLCGFPGGKIEFGEATEQAAVRELREETGVVAHATETFTALDAVETAADGAVMRHFVLIAVLCGWLSGEPVAGDDAMEARWFTFDELSSSGIQISLAVDEVAEKARQVQDRALQPCVSLRDVVG